MNFHNVIQNFLNKFRTFYWRVNFKKFGKNSRVLGRIFVHYPEKIFIGEKTTINEGVILSARGKIIIGDNVHISYGSILTGGGLDVQKFGEERKHFSEEIVIEDGAWIGSGAMIMPGATIGHDSVVAAGAVVIEDVPPKSVVGGIPAKVIKNL